MPTHQRLLETREQIEQMKSICIGIQDRTVQASNILQAYSRIDGPTFTLAVESTKRELAKADMLLDCVRDALEKAERGLPFEI